MERIILAFSADKTVEKIKSMLEGTEYFSAVAVCKSASELLRVCDEYNVSLIITGFKLTDMTVNHIYESLPPSCRILSIVKAEHEDDIEYDEITAIPLPVSRKKLVSAVSYILGYIPIKKHTASHRSEADSKIIEKAKLLLMERFYMTEDQAHRFIQKRSMDEGAKFVDIAKAVLNINDD